MTTTQAARREFRAMGTDCSVSVFGPGGHIEALADLAHQRVDLLEALWSRFRPDSELSLLNAVAGTGAREVSWETELLVHRMKEAWTATEGAFDPTVLAAVRANGYDRDLAEVMALESLRFAQAQAAPGMDAISVENGSVTLPAGVGLDPGAIGKGLAADIVVDEIFAAGATGVLVDLGGDIALAGVPGASTQWLIDVRDERTKGSSGRVIRVPSSTPHAGVATSTSLTRRFADARHHVIDPGTGSSTDESLVQVTVSGPSAWWCEVWATAALVNPALVADRLPEELSAMALGSLTILRDDFTTYDQSSTEEVA